MAFTSMFAVTPTLTHTGRYLNDRRLHCLSNFFLQLNCCWQEISQDPYTAFANLVNGAKVPIQTSVFDMDQFSHIVRFGVFEADLQTGELHKNGIKVRLQGQPFQVLAILLERS